MFFLIPVLGLFEIWPKLFAVLSHKNIKGLCDQYFLSFESTGT